jgi:hypothetical protein
MSSRTAEQPMPTGWTRGRWACCGHELDMGLDAIQDLRGSYGEWDTA